MEETVELISSGYEWTCLNCDTLNTTIEILEDVKCQECSEKFKVDDHHHAYG
jgi:DNA-directed RNA polymerase subunit RPC12/RpoP